VSDSGFVDEAARPGRDRPPPVGGAASDGPGRRLYVVLLTVVIAGMLGFAAWGWTGRAHSDDLAAWNELTRLVEEMDRSLPPLRHSEVPPCRQGDGGTITRGYPPSTGPQADELIGFLQGQGWHPAPPTPPALARLTRPVGDRLLTVDVEAPGRSQLVGLVTARSPGSAVGCLGR
jgi:hypothetical protein